MFTHKSKEPLGECAHSCTDVPDVERSDFGCVDPRQGIPRSTEDKLEDEQESERHLARCWCVHSDASSKQYQTDSQANSAEHHRLAAAEPIKCPQRQKSPEPEGDLNATCDKTARLPVQLDVNLKDDGNYRNGQSVSWLRVAIYSLTHRKRQ